MAVAEFRFRLSRVPRAMSHTACRRAPGSSTTRGSRASCCAEVVGLDPGGFASGFSPNPQIEVSQSATLHFEDTTPTDIGVVAGPPNTVAAPPRSLFQTVSYALKLILPVSWTMRAPGLVQVINSVTW